MQQVKTIVIVGGGTAGWMCAAALSQHFCAPAFANQPVNIRLIESSELGTVGVGESTIPSIRRFYARLGLSDLDVIKATRASCKLGIEFRNWRLPGHSFIHPFGLFGQPLNNIPFVQCYFAAKRAGLTHSFQDFSLGVALARDNKFCLPDPKPASMLTIFDWALHFDAALFAVLMRQCAEQKGVRRTDAKITSVQTDSNGIKDLILDNGEVVSADLYIDCSGFRGLLIEQALNTGYESWQHWLLCDRAVAVQTSSQSEPVARTRATAHSAGWQWRIPLQHRQGNGYVYASHLISDDEATATMLAHTDTDPLHAPRYFQFTPGRRKLAWHKNCVALGLASGFLEPLESTSIALIESSIERLLLTFQQPQYQQADVFQFNQVTRLEYERIRDFIIMHYKLTQRTDSELWRYCAAMDIPAELAAKLDAFRREAAVPRLPWEIFGADSWLALYDGMGLQPATIPPAALQLSAPALVAELEKTRHLIQQTAQKVPPHPAFLQRFCGYQPALSRHTAQEITP